MRISYYAHPDPKMPSLTLLPMIHLGEKAYYRAIKEEMWCHDKAYLEGCYMPARRTLYLWHRLVGVFSGLSLQSGKQSFFKRWKKEPRNSGETTLTESLHKFSCDCGDCYRLELRRIRADLHRWHALKAFAVMPWWVKISFPVLILIVLFSAPFLNLRDHALADNSDKECACKNGCQDDEFFLNKFFGPIFKFILDDRDLFLRMVLAEAVTDPINQLKSLCVQYGEKHMEPLAETLLKDFGYVLSSQRDILAVKKTKAMDVSNIETGYKNPYDRMWAKAYTWKERVTTTEVIASTTLSADYPTNFSLAQTIVKYNIPTDVTLVKGPNSKFSQVKLT